MDQTTGDGVRRADVIVVGGGLAGLTAAATAARAGRSVVVLERAAALGGRADTHERGGVRFNLGPHALYRAGHAHRILGELGVTFTGNVPAANPGLLLDEGAAYPIPAGPLALLRSRLLTPLEKWRLLRFLAGLGKIDARAIDRVPLRDWIERVAGRGNLARMLATLFRVATYADDHDRLSAGAALDQFRVALEGNVLYLDGGWRTLVDGLRAHAIEHGAEVRTSARVASVATADDGVVVRLADGEGLRGGAAVLAVGPDECVDLLGLPADSPLTRWAARRVPVRAACLDLALDGLPIPARNVAFGLDRPLYYSVHSASARLGPEGVAVLHAAKYLGGEGESDGGVEAELEGWLDRLQPGWRDRVVARRFLPGMVAAQALPTAEDGGFAGRPGAEVADRPGVFLAGDWVGPEGMIADAAVASARQAAMRALDALAALEARPGRRPAHAVA